MWSNLASALKEGVKEFAEEALQEVRAAAEEVRPWQRTRDYCRRRRSPPPLLPPRI